MRWLGLVLVVALSGAVVATNPGPGDFERELRRAVSDKAMTTLQDGDARDFAALAALNFLSAGSYRSYLVLARYDVRVLGKTLYTCYGAFDRITCAKARDD